MARPSAPFTSHSLAEVLDQVADHTPGPGGGAVAALTVAFAAALVEMTAKYDDSILARAREARANALRTRMLEVADVERDVYKPVLEAQAMDKKGLDEAALAIYRELLKSRPRKPLPFAASIARSGEVTIRNLQSDSTPQ